MVNQDIKDKINGFYKEEFKREIIEYYLSHKYTKQYVWEKFTGNSDDKGIMLGWMRKLGYIVEGRKRWPMQKKEKEKNELDISIESSRIKELEERLSTAELKVIAYSKMIDIAENKYKISIRKKYNTRP